MTTITNNELTTIRNNMANLLEEYNYQYSDSALDTIIEEWAAQKSTLIEAFKNHPNYVEGKFCIAFDSDYSREINTKTSKDFSNYLSNLMVSYTDSIPETVVARTNNGEDGFYKLPYILYSFLANLNRYATRTVSEETVAFLTDCIPEIHPHAGEKTSRVVNRICTYLGYSKDPDYNREFAKYADSLSPMTIKRHTIISLNPLDYLTMSFGNSWASCHTIDKQNKRGMPNNYNGMYSSGTMSYMLDPSSMVFYTVDKDYDGTDYWTQPKINRQMYHYGENKLVQGRLYPQCNDGNTDEYTIYRKIVQEVIALCFDMPNFWTVSKGTDAASRYINSSGTHYRDYNNFENCTLSKNKSYPNENNFTVGATPICIECGENHWEEDTINCCCTQTFVCADCGCIIGNEEYAHEIDGEIYCEDCCHYCDCCDEWCHGEETYIESENRYVCDACLEEYYSHCDCCDEYFDNDEVDFAYDENGYRICVCRNCYDEYYEECPHCQESYHRANMVRVADGSYVCRDCLENNYAQCEDCGEWYLIEELKATNDGFFCKDCYAEQEEPEEEE